MDTINDRIGRVVEASNLTKTEFGKQINLSQSMISKLCSGAATPSDRTISDICRKFFVNEVWLRTGEGDVIADRVEKEWLENVFSDSREYIPKDTVDSFISLLSQLPLKDAFALLKEFEDRMRLAIAELSNKQAADNLTDPQEE